jgi:hypothetical protein
MTWWLPDPVGTTWTPAPVTTASPAAAVVLGSGPEPGDDTLCGGPAPDVLDGGRGAGRDLPDGDGTSNRPRVGDTYISTDTYRLCLYQ